MLWKSTPKCPICGYTLEKKNKGYSCPNPECRVFKVFFNRDLEIRKVTFEGIDFLPMPGKTRAS